MFRKRRPEPASPMQALIVGLGNPGRQYAATRHNVSYRVVELVAEKWGLRLRRSRFRGRLALGQVAGVRVGLLQPTTFMNNSGQSVAPAARYYRVAPERILVISDDVHLELGRLRLRRGGSAGGHGGLASVIRELGSSDFPRLRVGVAGPGAEVDRIAYVLGRFRAEEVAPAVLAVRRAAEAVEVWLGEGLEAAANRFNAPLELTQQQGQQHGAQRQSVDDKGPEGTGAQPVQQEGDSGRSTQGGGGNAQREGEDEAGR